ncbi:hypothetical protein MTO96_027059 [Rhipicephalus appendiculatus]
MFYDLYCEDTDMVVLIMPLHENLLAASTYSEVMFVSETFYTLEGKIEAPSIQDTTLRSALTIIVTTASLTLCVGLLLLIGGNRLRERVQTETLFLLALPSCQINAISESEPDGRESRIFCLLVLGLSNAAAVSVLSRRTDLYGDGGVVLPNLWTRSRNWKPLWTPVSRHHASRGNSASLVGIQHWDHPTKLGQKLRASLFKHRDKLLSDSFYSCFECAARSGSVCYGARMPSSLLKGWPHRLAAFDENFMTRAFSMPLRKSFPLRDAYRAFSAEVD